MSSCPLVTDVGFHSLSKNCHNLERMDLEDCSLVNLSKKIYFSASLNITFFLADRCYARSFGRRLSAPCWTGRQKICLNFFPFQVKTIFFRFSEPFSLRIDYRRRYSTFGVRFRYERSIENYWFGQLPVDHWSIVGTSSWMSNVGTSGIIRLSTNNKSRY